MRRISVVVGIGILALVAVASAQNPMVFELPKLTQPPILDGNRFSVPDEWAGALQLECSPSQILRDGAEYGWRDMATQQSEVSVNQLVQSDGEDAAEARTDADYSSNIWQAWDDEALYYIAEVRDNVRDAIGAGLPTNWWERDSMSLYIDLVNSREQWGGSGYVYERALLNIINFVAAPRASSAATITWERLIQDERTPTQDPATIEGLDYAFRNAPYEFGGDADYVIEGKIPWRTLMRYNLPAVPTAGTEMGFVWLAVDPDGDEAYGGQIQCYGWADNPADFSTWIFVDTPAGPVDGTAVESDSWGGIKATFR